jgi:urea transporter
MRFKTNQEQPGQPDRRAQKLAVFLGVFSILLGLLELMFGVPIARALGLQNYEWLVRVYGAREILTGILILVFKDPTPWVWFRVIGDVLDVFTVAYGYSRHISPDVNFIVTAIVLAGAFIIDLYCALRLSKDSKEPLPSLKKV